MADVRLVDLEVIKRYSLAVRRDTVPAAEVLEALDASRAYVAAILAEVPTPVALDQDPIGADPIGAVPIGADPIGEDPMGEGS